MRAGVCTVAEREKCEVEVGDDPANLEWTCANCPKKRAEDLHPYTTKLLRLRTLKAAGFPFRANDLTPEEWLDLGRIEQEFEYDRQLRRNQHTHHR